MLHLITWTSNTEEPSGNTQHQIRLCLDVCQRDAIQTLTVDVIHQDLAETFQLVPKRGGDLEVRELRDGVAFFPT